jgi:hypothetical protein
MQTTVMSTNESPMSKNLVGKKIKQLYTSKVINSSIPVGGDKPIYRPLCLNRQIKKVLFDVWSWSDPCGRERARAVGVVTPSGFFSF